ncbi:MULTISPECIES: patatin-like phospholipase family protein [unclassified Dehalobacter]|uniref:patatin-like phospholipase family protein n=1 Tax=unclassified Dehalobacter TaxID=2635733 RepID=UPI000367E540|nr:MULTISPECIES: patatin-like phospholipase family protein [unclassified Dehalobacter]RJE48725.1 patatin [Dehalobacter sp. MCB1]TCX51818.1 patatin [Dehalobacter sp. 14DCB1]TCX52878.1 patatin [Dehalobacter sp. 12DCB1]
MYGLVLEGGGAKGAYQIGACKAMRELGISYGAVAGTSIGALNGAMIVQDELDKAYELWYEMSPSKVFDIEEVRLEELKKLDISHDGLLYYMKKAKEIASSKGLDITFIRKLLQEIVDEDKLRESKMLFGFTTVSLSDMKPMEFFLEDIPKGKVVEYLLASSNLPAFQQEKIDGKHYLDGGFYDNLPLNMLVGKGFKEIIAIRTNALGRRRKLADREVHVQYISPAETLGSILDFSNEQARYHLKLGYYDVIRQFRHLKGQKYYIEPTGDEDFFIRMMLSLGEKKILALGEKLGFKGIPYRRMLYEYIIPKIAVLLDLKKETSYEEMVIALLEFIALEQDIYRFRVYSFQDFLELISMNLREVKTKSSGEAFALPAFVKQSGVLPKMVKNLILRELIRELFQEQNFAAAILPNKNLQDIT